MFGGSQIFVLLGGPLTVNAARYYDVCGFQKGTRSLALNVHTELPSSRNQQFWRVNIQGKSHGMQKKP